MPQIYNNWMPDKFGYIYALLHELGHLKLLLLDEYLDFWYFPLKINIPSNYILPTLMAAGLSWPHFELSTDYDYDHYHDNYPDCPEHIIGHCYKNTWQYIIGEGSCWRRIFNDWNYFLGKLQPFIQIEHGIQFDLDGDELIDTAFWKNYLVDCFNTPYEWQDCIDSSTEMVRYPIGNHMTIIWSESMG
ncbi:MAG: hypothetical protein QXN93_05550 [Methanomassiliicoccales archaeon]